MPEELYTKCLTRAFEVRSILLKHNDIQDVYIYYDEHYQKPSSVHIWVLPIYKKNISKEMKLSMINHSIWEYMDGFTYQEEKNKINDILNEIKVFYR